VHLNDASFVVREILPQDLKLDLTTSPRIPPYRWPSMWVTQWVRPISCNYEGARAAWLKEVQCARAHGTWTRHVRPPWAYYMGYMCGVSRPLPTLLGECGRLACIGSAASVSINASKFREWLSMSLATWWWEYLVTTVLFTWAYVWVFERLRRR